jgi:hypothetical protein
MRRCMACISRLQHNLANEWCGLANLMAKLHGVLWRLVAGLVVLPLLLFHRSFSQHPGSGTRHTATPREWAVKSGNNEAMLSKARL